MAEWLEVESLSSSARGIMETGAEDRRRGSRIGITAGVLAGGMLVVSSVAHAFMGWPPYEAALAAQGVDQSVLVGLSVGWFFGSVAMLTLGLLILWMVRLAAWGDLRSPMGAWMVALAYAGFGIVAFVLQGLNPHFLAFIVNGILVAGFAVLAVPRASRSA
jgi:hypothetical protein